MARQTWLGSSYGHRHRRGSMCAHILGGTPLVMRSCPTGSHSHVPTAGCGCGHTALHSDMCLSPMGSRLHVPIEGCRDGLVSLHDFVRQPWSPAPLLIHAQMVGSDAASRHSLRSHGRSHCSARARLRVCSTLHRRPVQNSSFYYNRGWRGAADFVRQQSPAPERIHVRTS